MLRRHRSYSSTGWNGPPNTGKRGAASLPVVGPHEWRHESGPTHRPSYFPRPEDERQIIRRKSFTLPTSTVDEAALQMDLLDYDFTCSPRRARTPTVSSTVPDRRVTVWHK
jgi:Sigma 54 modulation/S30EA ribosomal protein C terminus